MKIPCKGCITFVMCCDICNKNVDWSTILTKKCDLLKEYLSYSLSNKEGKHNYFVAVNYLYTYGEKDYDTV